MNILVRTEIPFNIQATTTIGQLKQFLRNNSFDISTASLVFNDGQQLSPVVFQTTQYDNMDFKQHSHQLKGSSLIVTKIVTKIEQKHKNKYYSVAVTGYVERLLNKDNIRDVLIDAGLEYVDILFIKPQSFANLVMPTKIGLPGIPEIPVPVQKNPDFPEIPAYAPQVKDIVYLAVKDNNGNIKFQKTNRLPEELQKISESINESGYIVFGNSKENGGLDVELSVSTVKEAVDSLDYMQSYGITDVEKKTVKHNNVDNVITIIEFDTESG